MQHIVTTQIILIDCNLFLPYLSKKKFTLEEKKKLYLFVKVCIKHNQVEVALQALHGSVEKVVFGTASLRNKQELQYLFIAAAHISVERFFVSLVKHLINSTL